MNYASVIAKYKEIHRQASQEEILSLWNKSKPALNVYVHSPFCLKKCAYCYYQGAEFDFKRDQSLYEKYYYHYLPKAIKPFLPIIESRQPGNYYFGGGTASLMNPETMGFVFDLFPGFREIKSKTFEIHSAVWTEEQLDVLADYKFNCCILGIQSFDKSALDRQGRLYAPREKIKSLAQKIKARGMYLAIDLIYRMDSVDADNIFRQDLEYLVELDSDIISLQYNYNETESHVKSFYDIISYSSLATHYSWVKATPEQPAMPRNVQADNKVVRYAKNNLSLDAYYSAIFNFLRTGTEGSKLFFRNTPSPSLIGFGSYQNSRTNTFSNISYDRCALEYIEINNNWVPEYYITFHEDRREITLNTMALMKEFNSLGTPPDGISFRIFNRAAAKDGNTILRKPYVIAGLEIFWETRSVAVAEFLDKLKHSFPNTIEYPSSIIITGK